MNPRVRIAPVRAKTLRARQMRQPEAWERAIARQQRLCAVMDGRVRRALRSRSASDLGVLSAFEHLSEHACYVCAYASVTRIAIVATSRATTTTRAARSRSDLKASVAVAMLVNGE
jgi:hypothetical protein